LLICIAGLREVLCVSLFAFGVDNVFFGSVYFAARMAVAKGLVVLQPLQWRCVDCVIHHERDENKNIYVWREQAIIKEIAMHDLYCCLLPRCEALRTCHSGFLIATKWCCDQDLEVVLKSAFSQRTCDWCHSL